MKTLNAFMVGPPITLRPDTSALYRTPTGRLCRVVALDGRGGVEPVAQLEYVHPQEEGRRYEWGDGFSLRPENWRILRRVG